MVGIFHKRDIYFIFDHDKAAYHIQKGLPIIRQKLNDKGVSLCLLRSVEYLFPDLSDEQVADKEKGTKTHFRPKFKQLSNFSQIIVIVMSAMNYGPIPPTIPPQDILGNSWLLYDFDNVSHIDRDYGSKYGRMFLYVLTTNQYVSYLNVFFVYILVFFCKIFFYWAF